MLVSVVMITYNHEKYIEKAVDSVLSQKGDFDLELLIGNDKSPDNTKKILEKYKNNKRVRIFNREQNLGATKNNINLRLKAKGDYIAVLEGDDYWLDEYKIQKQLKLLISNENSILVYSDSYVVDENDKIIGKKFVKNNKIINFKSLMANKNEIPTGTILYKNIFKENNEIEKVIKLLQSSVIIGDFPLFALLISKGEFLRLPELTGVYRFITNSKISTSYSSRNNYFKELELYKATKGIVEYYEKFNFYRWCMLQRRKNSIIKQNKKEKNKEENLNIKTNVVYKLYKPIDDLILSFYKRIYKR
ncbi:glycosyltransferase [Fusobacterium sp. MFO224]|uniref:glycosyltransferase n=1 Tax=Fusobacterium sp. MFO224 TaxID=3378070 RepID=UPI0038523DA4